MIIGDKIFPVVKIELLVCCDFDRLKREESGFVSSPFGK